MAWKAQELVAKHQIVGVLKDARPIMPGTRFECKDEATEKQLLKSKAAEVAEPWVAPDVVKADAGGTKTRAKPAPSGKPKAPAAKAPEKPADTDKDLV